MTKQLILKTDTNATVRETWIFEVPNDFAMPQPDDDLLDRLLNGFGGAEFKDVDDDVSGEGDRTTVGIELRKM